MGTAAVFLVVSLLLERGAAPACFEDRMVQKLLWYPLGHAKASKA